MTALTVEAALQHAAIAAQIQSLRELIKVAEQERQGVPSARRTELAWLCLGAGKHLVRLGLAARAVRSGQHQFLIHAIENGQIWAVCCCGGRIRGRMNHDMTLAEFLQSPDHVILTAPRLGEATSMSNEGEHDET